MESITPEKMIREALNTLGSCTVAEIQRLFRGLSEATIIFILEEMDVDKKLRTCDVTKEGAFSYSLITEKTQEEIIAKLQSQIEELQKSIALIKKPHIKRKRMPIFRCPDLRYLPPNIIEIEPIELTIEPVIEETTDPDEALQQALAQLAEEDV
jgi:hypothetical protein